MSETFGIAFDWPWLALALPLPWLLRALMPPARASGLALRIPFLPELLAVAGSSRASSRLPWLPLLAWLLLVIAAMRPVSIGAIVMPETSGRDLLVIVDVSGSMAAEDMQIGRRQVTRLDAVKTVVGDFLGRRIGDRVGLMLFGQRAYLVTPLTLDRAVVKAQLLDSVVGLAGRETAIGDAIGLGVKRLRDRKQQQRVMILLTDGVNTAGVLEPARAAELAKAANIRVYTIGMGSEQSASPFGFGLVNPNADIDEPMLKAIAATTGGRYFRARDTQELAGIYAELDRLEPALQQAEPLRPRQARYAWPLAMAVLLALLGLSIAAWRGSERSELRT